MNRELALSQELRFVSDADQPFSYIVGLYGDISHEFLNFNMDFNTSQQAQNSPDLFFNSLLDAALAPYYTATGLPPDLPNGAHVPVFATVEQQANIKTFAAYVEGTWKATDALSLTAGVRFTVTDKSGYVSHVGPNPFYGPFPYTANYGRAWYQWMPRFIADYKIRDGLMLYASASSGTKSGGFDYTFPTAAALQLGLEPETSWSYEAGVKTLFFDDTLSVNLAAYHALTSNLQVRTLNQGQFFETNAGHLTANGVISKLSGRRRML